MSRCAAVFDTVKYEFLIHECRSDIDVAGTGCWESSLKTKLGLFLEVAKDWRSLSSHPSSVELYHVKEEVS